MLRQIHIHLLCHLISTSVQLLPPVIRIGAIFLTEERGAAVELAFKFTIYRINKDKSIFPNSIIVYDIKYVERDDSFKAMKHVCNQLENGVHIIFGPSDSLLGQQIQSICETYKVPHIEIRNDYQDSLLRGDFKSDSIDFHSINLYPPQVDISHSYNDLIRYLNWTKLCIIYEPEFGGNILKHYDLLHYQNVNRFRPEVYFRHADITNYRDILIDIRRRGIFKIILDTNYSDLPTLFRMILQLQMNDYRYHYMFASFDVNQIDLEDFVYNSVNMTSFSLVSDQNVAVKEFLLETSKLKLNQTFNSSAFLVFDAISVLVDALKRWESDPRLLKSFSCNCSKGSTETPWDMGQDLLMQLDTTRISGLTGKIEFDKGKRKNMVLNLMKLKKEKLEQVGIWQKEGGINLTDTMAFFDQSHSNITLVVMTRIETPYVMLKASDGNLTGNNRFEGFCIDLLKGIAQLIGFQYDIRLVPDHMYGVYDPETKQWNGIVRELMEQRADLAVASMTINYARESVIDFTKPFMNLGIGILFKIPKSQPTRLFSFMNPLAKDIWLYVLAAYLLVSFTLFVMARFSPYEWNLQVTNDLSEVRYENYRNQFNISNSFWFITGTFLRQGSGLNPKATSTRIVGGIWWFFTLIIISSYTANLAAFLTVERTITPIENAADLAEQQDISYGTLSGGSTMTFFRDSKIGIYQKMWRFMDAQKSSVFVNTYEAGIKRVLEGNYAFLMESTMLDYVVQRDCNLTQIGGLLDSKGYGIATPKGSKWRDKISLAILELQEKGAIQMLYDKWWKNTGDVCNRDDKTKESKANALGINNIGGVFVVLLCGLALAILVAIFEFCWNTKQPYLMEMTSLEDGGLIRSNGVDNPIDHKIINYTPSMSSKGCHHQSLCAEMAQEFRFALQCNGNSKQRPALKRVCLKCKNNGSHRPERNVVLTYVPTDID